MAKPSHDSCAIASGNLQIEESGAEVIVFDPALNAFHLLNTTAYGILKACTGSNTARDIAIGLRSSFGFSDFDAIVNDVSGTLELFREKGLIKAVVPAWSAQSLSTDTASDGSLIAVSVTGMSMFPVLLSGDRVLVKRSSIGELRVGDVIAWTDQSGHLIVHRIHLLETAVTRPSIITKGDFCPEADSPVQIDQVLGKVVAALREGSVQWMGDLDLKNSGRAAAEGNGERAQGAAPRLPQRPSYKDMRVLDLRDISPASISAIGSVEQVGLVLLSPRNAHAWPEVSATDVKAVLTVPDDYRVYTGQPELLPELVSFIQAPLKMVVSGQLFLTAFAPHEIPRVIEELILNGQAYVASAEAKTTLERLSTIVAGEICIAPEGHSRWIGSAILGPEYVDKNRSKPLVVVGELAMSDRMAGVPAEAFLFHKGRGNDPDTARAI
jgi:signal peptidase I